MRTKKISLDCFGEEYSGWVEVKRLTHAELNLVRETSGIIDFQDKEEKTAKENLSFLNKAYEMARPYLVSAEVERKKDGAKLNLEDLEYETELQEFCSNVVISFLSGWAMGNEKGQPQG